MSYEFGCYPSGFRVRSHIVVVGGLGEEGDARHGFLDDVAHAEEGNPVVQEGGYHHFVGGVDDAGHVARTVQRLVGKRQVAEAGGVGLLEGQPGAGPEVQPGERCLSKA